MSIGEHFETGKLDALVAALNAYSEAQKEAEECFEQCEYSPGYHCRRFIDARQEAADEFGRRLKAFVADCITETLTELLKNPRPAVQGEKEM